MRITKARTPCVALPDCGRDGVKQSGLYCDGHYQQFRGGKPFTVLQVKLRNTGKCAYPPCLEASKTKGYCRGHYQQLRLGQTLSPLDPRRSCDFPDCPEPHEAKGYCNGHYGQLRNEQVLRPLQKLHASCTFVQDGYACTRPHEARGYCYGHYEQLMRGRPLLPLNDTPSPIDFVDNSFRVAVYGYREGKRGVVVAHAKVSVDDLDKVRTERWYFGSGLVRSICGQLPKRTPLHAVVMTPGPDEL